MSFLFNRLSARMMCTSLCGPTKKPAFIRSAGKVAHKAKRFTISIAPKPQSRAKFSQRVMVASFAAAVDAVSRRATVYYESDSVILRVDKTGRRTANPVEGQSTTSQPPHFDSHYTARRASQSDTRPPPDSSRGVYILPRPTVRPPRLQRACRVCCRSRPLC